MLSKDPQHRPSLDRVLAHPFLSLKRVARLVGERAKFDLFLSYRVNSDVALAEKIYDALTATGLNVWWDKRSLQPGLDWKDALCAGLMDSTHYLVLLSKVRFRALFMPSLLYHLNLLDPRRPVGWPWPL
jgi:hypothetical protein